ncbi:MAG: outer membrane lipoprotein carrier protein LolA [Candidatus Eisenbacteria bacterium]
MSFRAKAIYVVVTTLFLVAFAIPLLGLAQRSALHELVARVDKRLSSLESLSASFEQTREISLTGQKLRASGRLYLRKPRKILLDYAKPEPQKLIVNDSVVMIYVPSLKQVQRFDMEESPDEQSLFLFWEAFSNVEKRFRIAPGSPRDARFRYVELTPLEKADAGGVKRLVIGIDTSLLLPRDIEIEESSGDVVRMRLSQIKTNPKLEDSLFELNLEKDVELIDYSR